MNDEDDVQRSASSALLPAARSKPPKGAGDLATGWSVPPIFLHSSFRTGSTWLWLKLRRAPTTCAYYEIFNEGLAAMTIEAARGIDHASWESRHPAASPYFLEFAPLIGSEPGIAGFEAGMSFESFIPAGGPNGHLNPGEIAYVDRLLAEAWSRGRIPLVSCTRSLGRARALRQAFGGQTVMLHRNLFHQWASYAALAEAGNDTFLRYLLSIFRTSSHDPFLRTVSEWLRLGTHDPPTEALFQAFVVLHLYLHSIAFDAADLVVDLNDIARSAHARGEVQRALSNMVKSQIDLSDVREPGEFGALSLRSSPESRDTIEQLAKLIPAAAVSADALAFVERTKQAALSEWERFEFFTRRPMSLLNARIESAAGEIERLQGKASQLDAALSDATKASAAAGSEAEQHRQALDNEKLASDGFRERALRAEAERDKLDARYSELSSDIDAEREAKRSLLAEYEALQRRMFLTGAEVAELRSCLDAMMLERDEAHRQVAKLDKERGALRQEADAAATTRDELALRLHEAKVKHSNTHWERLRRRMNLSIRRQR